MGGQKHRLKSPCYWFVLIPLQLLINELMVPLGLLLDILVWEKGTFPRTDYMYLLPLLGGVVTCIVMPIFVVIIQEALSRHKQKQKSSFRWLILIPAQLLSLVCMYPLGMFLDQMIYNANGQIYKMHNAYERARGYEIVLTIVSLIKRRNQIAHT